MYIIEHKLLFGKNLKPFTLAVPPFVKIHQSDASRDWTRASQSYIQQLLLCKKLTFPDSSTELFEIITAITVLSVKSPGTVFERFLKIIQASE